LAPKTPKLLNRNVKRSAREPQPFNAIKYIQFNRLIDSKITQKYSVESLFNSIKHTKRAPQTIDPIQKKQLYSTLSPLKHTQKYLDEDENIFHLRAPKLKANLSIISFK